MLPLETSCYFALAKLKVNAYVVSLSTLFLSDYQILCNTSSAVTLRPLISCFVILTAQRSQQFTSKHSFSEGSHHQVKHTKDAQVGIMVVKG